MIQRFFVEFFYPVAYKRLCEFISQILHKNYSNYHWELCQYNPSVVKKILYIFYSEILKSCISFLRVILLLWPYSMKLQTGPVTEENLKKKSL